MASEKARSRRALRAVLAAAAMQEPTTTSDEVVAANLRRIGRRWNSLMKQRWKALKHGRP